MPLFFCGPWAYVCPEEKIAHADDVVIAMQQNWAGLLFVQRRGEESVARVASTEKA